MPEFIDRKALGIGKCNPDVFNDRAYADGWNAAIDMIENAPAADVDEVIYGKWIDKCVRDWHCSRCDYDIEKVRKVDGYCYDDLPNFCPNCGARMLGMERWQK